MKNLKPPAALFLITVASGMMMGSSSLLPLGLGLSLFIPALFIYSYINGGAPITLLSLAIAVIVILAANRDAVLDVTSIALLGPVYLLLKRTGVSAAVLGGAFLLTLFTALEETLIGLPPEVKKEFAQVSNYRYSLYFLSSAIYSIFTYGVANWIVKELPPVTEIRFGFWNVVLFTLSAIATLLGKGDLKIVAVNILLASITLFIVQGISVFLWFFPKLSTTWKLITGLLIFIFPPGFFLTTLFLGLLDQKLNFRKLKGGKEDGGNPS